MEENKGSKISLTSAILFFLAIFAIVGIALICMSIKEKSKEEKQVLQTEVDGLQKEIEEFDSIKDTDDIINLKDYEGLWYQNEKTINKELLEIKNVKDNTATINIFFYRIAGMEDTIVNFVDNKCSFEEYNEEKTGKINGEIIIENNKIVVNVISSSIYAINNNSQYVFTYKELAYNDTEKTKINEKLKTYITLPLRQITDIEYGKDFKYNINLLNEEKNKYYIVIATMLKEVNDEFSFVNSEGQEETGAIAISVDRVNDYYKKFYGKDMNKDELLSSDIAYGIKIKDGILYGTYPTGFGVNPFELKTKTLKKDDVTGIYTLKADVLMKILGKEEGYTKFDEDVTDKYGESSVLTWPEEYNYATLEIQYKKNANGNDQLISLMFVK